MEIELDCNVHDVTKQDAHNMASGADLTYDQDDVDGHDIACPTARSEVAIPCESAVSSGGIVIRTQYNEHTTPYLVHEVLLVAQPIQNNRFRWTIPKGRVEAGETIEKAAVREVLEETGYSTTILSTLPSSAYIFYTPEGQKIDKTVHYFAMRPDEAAPRVVDDDILAAQWFSLQDAMFVVNYKQERVTILSAFPHTMETHGHLLSQPNYRVYPSIDEVKAWSEGIPPAFQRARDEWRERVLRKRHRYRSEESLREPWTIRAKRTYQDSFQSYTDASNVS